MNLYRSLLIIIILASLTAAPVAAANSATLSFGPAVLNLQPGAGSAMAVRVDGIQGLYGFEMRLAFDPAVMQVVDADSQKAGVQVQVGDFLSPDFIVRNQTDNQAGVIEFALTQLNPNEPRNGGGALFNINLQAKAAGQSVLQVTSSTFADRDAGTISVTTQPGRIHVDGQAVPNPTSTPTSQTAAPTASPPTAVPTALPPTAQPTAGHTAPDSGQPTAIAQPTALSQQPSATPTGQPSVEIQPQTQAPTAKAVAQGVTAAPATPAANPKIAASDTQETAATGALTSKTATPALLAKGPAAGASQPILPANRVADAQESATRAAPDGTNNWLLIGGMTLLVLALGCAAALLFARMRRPG